MSRLNTKFYGLSSVVFISTCFLVACSGHSAFENSMNVSAETRLKMFKNPTEVLTPSTTESTQKEYSVYKLVSAKFGADSGANSISAQVTVVSNAGTELVDLVGALRPDGTASLVDLHPLDDSKNRLIAEALCVDEGPCKQIILNVYYNVDGENLKRQFTSDSLKVSSQTASSPPIAAPVTSPKIIDDDELHPTEKDLSDQSDESDEKLGDFVGAPRNEVLIGNLWQRSKTPELPPVSSRVEDPKKTRPTIPPAAPAPVQLPAPAVPLSKPTVAPAPPPLSPPDQSRPKPKPVSPAAPAKLREQKPAAQPPALMPKRAPAPVPPPSATEVPHYPFPPPKPISTDGQLDQKITLLEAHLAPLLNLREGGVAQGGYSDSNNERVKSSIVHSSLLPSNIPGLVPVVINQSAHYGSGMLVSFLENAASYLFEQLGLKLFVGDMSLRNGGWYGRSSAHHTHRNGLDADIAWIGIAHPLHDSALDTSGRVVAGFDYEKTWNFLRLAATQEIVQDAQKTTAVSRVFMSPSVKVGFCSWAKQNKKFDDPFNAELMRLVRPVGGHYKHFHLSLKCSPHYPLCRNLAGPPPPGTGCP